MLAVGMLLCSQRHGLTAYLRSFVANRVYGFLHAAYCLLERRNKFYHMWFGWSCLSSNSQKLLHSCQLFIVVIRSWLLGKRSIYSDNTLDTYFTSGCEDQKFSCPHSHCTNHLSTSCQKHNSPEVKLQNSIFPFCKFAWLQFIISWHSILCFSFFVKTKFWLKAFAEMHVIIFDRVVDFFFLMWWFKQNKT